ncbi:hypothetical protein CWATWH8502_4356 [Crocosphaera watsonii WH 8502]|uniref:Uncharacterized protein n=2 Tax=Crocosphaera watsonii TaxID=263511 RepID=T2I6V5_CROWT|nr:hypothetical protein [Crocosphaera sp.]NQZ65482.1 hypothetical protein [Crocosphaera sp.]CCQ48971.1 hypothetical protein CWATWH8502_4356 [Crocosphaera watsonii WH 8502]
MINFKSVVTTSAFSLLSLAAAPMASAITITSNGTWTGVQGNPSGVTTGLGTSEVRWGNPAPGQPTNTRISHKICDRQTQKPYRKWV